MNTRLIAGVGIIFALVYAGSAQAELVDNGDGTVTDTNSHLMWLKNADLNGPMNLASANTWLQNLNATKRPGGHSDWRLPSGANRDGSPVCNSATHSVNCTGTEFATLYFARSIQFHYQGPFLNLRQSSYWTSTDNPANALQAMAQDFDNGGQTPFAKTTPLFIWPVRAAEPVPPETPLLYGVVSPGTNAGALVQIDTQTGALTMVGSTGFAQACGLAFDRLRARLLLNPCIGTAPLQIINTGTGTATPLGTATTAMRPIAHRHVDDFFYGIEASPALLRANAATGGSSTTLGAIDKQSTGGIAVRPSDGGLFGIGMTSATGTPPNNQQLFTLQPAAGSGARDTNVGSVAIPAVRALTFHPDGRLFATNGTLLLTLNPSTGAVLKSVQLSGASIGPVSGLAATGSRLVSGLDVWLKDCAADGGDVPTDSTACAKWWVSPDIRIDNNGDDIEDQPVWTETSTVKIRVRNRGTSPSSGTVAKLYFYTTPNASTPPTSSTLVGSRTVSVAAGATAMATISWRPSILVFRQGTTYCLSVSLSHPQDLANPQPSPTQDNNKAVRCETVRLVPVPVPGPVPVPVP